MTMWNDYEKIARRLDRIANAFERIANALETANIIEADRKTEPLTPNYCGTCKHREVPCGDLPCDVCHDYSNYEPKTEPQTDCSWK